MRRLVWLWLLLLSQACSEQRPDLPRLYQRSMSEARLPPVVVIHGVFGGRLQNGEGEELWPGPWHRLLWHDYRELALPLDAQTLEPLPDGLQAAGITDRVAGRDFYGALLQVLQEAGGYQLSRPGQRAAAGAHRFYVFSYDWRQDNVLSARKLDDFIAQIRRDYGDPALKVDLVAHSMGGLLARYYLRYGRRDVLNGNEFPVSNEGAQKVRRVIVLGTPSLGSVSALQNMLTGFRVGLGRIPPEALATMPSAYQLLPHPLNDWLLSAAGQPLERDLFDIEVWRRFEWFIFDPTVRARIRQRFASEAAATAYLQTLERYMARQLERARRFVWALTVREVDSPVRLIVFGGACSLTPARVLVEEVGGDSVLRLWPHEVLQPQPGVDYERLMLEPGDGRVTKASLLARTELDPRLPRHRYSYFPLDYTVLLCEAHDQLTANPNFQDNLLHVLLSAEP